MVAGSEGQLCLDADLDDVGTVACIRIKFRMFGIVDHYLVAHEDRFEALLLPFLVPVLVFGILDVVGYLGVHDREVGDVGIQRLLVEEVFLHVCLHTRFGFFKRFESSLGSTVGEQVLAGLHQVGRCLDIECRY